METSSQKWEPTVPKGHVLLESGADIKIGDLMWRGMYAAFIPLSLSQIKTCDHVLRGDVIIRPKGNK